MAREVAARVVRVTDPYDFTELSADTEPIVPNHRASEGTPQSSEPSTAKQLFRRSQPREKARTTRTAPPPENVPGQFVQPLEDVYSTLAMAMFPFKPQVAMAIIGPAREPTEEELAKRIEPPTVAHNCAVAWDEVAQKNESVRRVLKSMTTVGVWGGLFMAHAPILAAVMAETSMPNPFSPVSGAENLLREQAERNAEGDWKGE